MRTRFWIHASMLVAAVAIAATLSAPPLGGQQFSAWSAPVNLNAVTLSDGAACPAVVNSGFRGSTTHAQPSPRTAQPRPSRTRRIRSLGDSTRLPGRLLAGIC